MPPRHHALLPSLLLALALAGCGAAPGALPGAFILARPDAALALLGVKAAKAAAVLSAPTLPPASAWAWEVRPDAAWAPFERAEPPKGPSLHLDFKAWQAGGPGDEPPRGDHQIYYRDGLPFSVHLVAGARFDVLDRDASDGEATVAFPPGAHAGWLARRGEPGGTLLAEDPAYFRRETIQMETGPRDWLRLQARALPWPWGALHRPADLRFEPRGLPGFATRWQTAAAEAPPLPPAIADLSVPPELLAGDAGDATALAAGPGGQPPGTTYRWRSTDPDGRPLPTQTADAPTLAWRAPDAPGTYLLDLVVETPWYRATAPAPKLIQVRREVFLDSYGPIAQPWPDLAEATASDTWPLTPGVRFELSAEGTMNPWGGPDMVLCGAPEPLPMYPSPTRPIGVVALDPAYFFAAGSYGGCKPFTPLPTGLLGFRTVDLAAWSVPRPLPDVYQPSHRYAFPAVIGADRPLAVRVMDPRVWDNYGRFKITIRRPAGV